MTERERLVPADKTRRFKCNRCKADVSFELADKTIANYGEIVCEKCLVFSSREVMDEH